VSDPAFVGIDLAWGARARTGLAVVDPTGSLIDSASVRSDEEIDEWLDRAARTPVVVAIDAPLVVTNATGQRSCERMVSQQFGRFGASCHTSNLGRSWFNPPRGATLADRHGWGIDATRVGTEQHPVALEVYPHPAMVALFALDRVIAYKGKAGRSVGSRRSAFRDLIGHMDTLRPLNLGASDRWGVLNAAVDLASRQVDLDRIEDEIDAIFCAHLAWLWHHDRDSMQVFGDRATGSIVTPMLAQER
jgi:predicted RNase H-like nuclease